MKDFKTDEIKEFKTDEIKEFKTDEMKDILNRNKFSSKWNDLPSDSEEDSKEWF